MRLTLLFALFTTAIAYAPVAEARTTTQTRTTQNNKKAAAKKKKKKNPVPKAFRAGAKRFNFSAGTAGSFGQRYIIAGGGFGYFLADGLELGIDAEYWFPEEPTVFKLSPQIRYVAYQVKTVQPYLGAFYRRIFMGDGPNGEQYEDTGSLGGRAGIYYKSGRGVYMNLGVVYEQKLDCTPTANAPCEDIYPEIGVSVSM
ncbi:hypothetical protein KKF91_06375 [Myxococcota bacterium]|nr:hypothetical protein [Myxococcota bacterium]